MDAGDAVLLAVGLGEFVAHVQVGDVPFNAAVQHDASITLHALAELAVQLQQGLASAAEQFAILVLLGLVVHQAIYVKRTPALELADQDRQHGFN